VTDRIHAVTIYLEHDTRDDDAEELLTLLKNLKGVGHVSPHVMTSETAMAREHMKHELRALALQAVRDVFDA
jgi:hypothetical protein